MRDVPSGIIDNLQQQHGAEPLLIIEVQWVDDGPRIMYSDQKLSGLDYPYPRIVQVGNFDMAIQVDGASDSQQINITLDDIDGKLKALLDTYDIHKRPVWVYQGLITSSFSSKVRLAVLLFGMRENGRLHLMF